MTDENTSSTPSDYPVKCPFCCSENPIGSSFCQDCGRKFSDQPAQQSVKTEPYQQPQTLKSSFQAAPPYIERSHKARNLIVTVVAAVLIVSLVFAAVLFMSPINGNNNSQTSPTPSATPANTGIPTVVPTLTPTQPPNNTITAINLQFMYQASDPDYFGPSSTLNFTNQPNGMLSIYQASRFSYSFKLWAGTPAAPDSITSISVSTSGFSLVSFTPSTPIAFTAGASVTISVTIQTPQESFYGPITLVITTSGTTG